MEHQVNSLWTQLNGWLPAIMSYASQLVLAIIVLLVGWAIINMVSRGLGQMMAASHIEPTLRGFLLSVVGLFLKALLLISVASMVGIATTSFVAVLGAAGLAVGMALQGSLANFAGGVLILLFRPFKVGDSITSGGSTGTVESIEMFRTVLRGATNEIIYVPNGNLSNNIVVNTSQEDKRLASVSLLIDYNDDTDKARALLLELVQNEPLVLNSPVPSVSFLPQPANIQVSLSFWCAPSNVTPLTGKYAEASIKTLKQAGFRLGVSTRAAA
ncbi:mechanosensitive ion channel [Acetobacter suratthaniensis]|uniref:Small-conductance mechanosensitive channel n=1 Tax=Acetobacter suratthaniensis TaxID=1502841 RepID=A0ABS3LLP7_9PROT|nr:mechanosensitive ion channel domain-containing protein [Acetobacter suratthaniensis]MBO1328280.1 mechanosensitive ion channel [Acetobacter suratthaniensis]MCX2566402.1 mechanosensitive ion channel [Acetobacter suratthaniensis]